MADRIVSLLPAATEALYAMGLGARVRARSHACDHPPVALALPAATRSRVDADGTSAEIDRAVRERVEAGEPMNEVLESVLHHVQPDLVVAQETCDVCGITPTDVGAALSRIEPDTWPTILTLHAHTLEGALQDLRVLGRAAGDADAADALVVALRRRMTAVEERAAALAERPTVAVLDWLDPPMVAGHWVPGMVELAGGEPLLLDGAEPSTYVDWDEVVQAAPDVLVLAPCGFDAERTVKEVDVLRERDGWDELPAVSAGRVVTLDAGAYLSRPGPRLVDGLELLALALHPDVFEERYPEHDGKLTWLA